MLSLEEKIAKKVGKTARNLASITKSANSGRSGKGERKRDPVT